MKRQKDIDDAMIIASSIGMFAVSYELLDLVHGWRPGSAITDAANTIVEGLGLKQMIKPFDWSTYTPEQIAELRSMLPPYIVSSTQGRE